MKSIIGKIFKAPTLFSILGIIVIVIGLPIGIYGLTLKGGGSLGGVIILFGIFIVGIIVVVDRLFANRVNKKKNKRNSQRIQPWKMNDFKIRFYSNGDLRFNETEIDSIIKKEIKTVANTVYN